MDTILHPFAVAVAWVWVRIHDLLVLLGMASGSGIAWVISIVILTIAVRALLIPLYLRQIRSMRNMQVIQPELKKIQEKYKNKKDQLSQQRMSEETQALYKKHGTSPFSSCLPLLIQMPILFAMYRAIYAIEALAQGTYSYSGNTTDHLGPITQSIAQEIDGSTVFGVSLSSTFTTADGIPAKSVFVVLIVLMVIGQFLTMRLTMNRNTPPLDTTSNPMAQSQRSMMYVMPLMYIFSGAFFQMGVLVYTFTATLWALGQQYWVIKVMPTPGSPAHHDLVVKRETKYKEWAKDYFADYDDKRAQLTTQEDIDAFNAATRKELVTRSRSSHIDSHFPEQMSDADVVGIYRNLSIQEWTTLPDSIWMTGIKHHAEQQAARQAALEARQAVRKRTKEQPKEKKKVDRAAAEASPLDAAELEARRQRRRAERRNRRRK